MSYASTGDGNLAALQKYEEQLEKNESDYAAFEIAIEEAGIETELEELISKFNSIAENFNIVEDFNEYFSK